MCRPSLRSILTSDADGVEAETALRALAPAAVELVGAVLVILEL